MNPLTSTSINQDGLNLSKKAATYCGVVSFVTTGLTVTFAVPSDFKQFIPVGLGIGTAMAADDEIFIDTAVHTYNSTRGTVSANVSGGTFSVTLSRKSGSPTSGLSVGVLLISVP